MFRWLLFLLTTFSLVAFGVWWFFGEVVMLWATVLLNLIKGLSLKAILTWLVELLGRWFLVELPKRFLQLLVFIGLPTRYRRRIKVFMARTREYARALYAYLKAKLTSWVGDRVALALAIVATMAVLMVSIVTTGVWFILVLGGSRMWRFLMWLAELVWFYTQNTAFRIAMAAKLDRVWNWFMQITPTRYQQVYRIRRFGALRGLRRRVQRYERRLRARKRQREKVH